MTSVKSIIVGEEPTETELGTATFRFSDAYSVFDWGQMPDAIPHKGQSLCVMGASNFEALEAAGVATHYRGVQSRLGDDPVSLEEVDDPPRIMAIEYANRPPLPQTDEAYDYTAYHEAAGDAFVVPLEVVFRNRVPIGSSLRRRKSPDDVGLNRTDWPDSAVTLPEPIVEFSTKFEASDRYLTDDEADRIAGAADLAAIRDVANQVNELITQRAETAGFRHDDGKIELVYHQGTLLVADVVGTFDENRFTFDGQQVSKEVLRQYYRKFDPDWVEAVETAKATATERDDADWKQYCDRSPAPLPRDVVETAGELYAAGANRYLDQAHFDVPDLAAVIEDIRAFAPAQ